MLAACGGDAHEREQNTRDDGLMLERDGALVNIPPSYLACEQDSDCTLVPIGCDGCCQTGAVASNLSDEYSEAFEAACSDYSGGICDCDPPEALARCIDNLCKASIQDKVPPGEDDEQACLDVNAALDLEYAELTACKVDSDCGDPLPTLGSCGCDSDRVGRADADITELESLLRERDALSHVRGCGQLAGPCVCEPATGVACENQRCVWVYEVEQANPCTLLDDATFVSDEPFPCNGVPDGDVADLCHWALEFSGPEVQWTHEDVVLPLQYDCTNGIITASYDDEQPSLEGTISSDGALTFDGTVYHRSADGSVATNE